MEQSLMRKYAKQGLEFCDDFFDHAKNTELLLSMNGLNINFWQHTLDKLELEHYIPNYFERGCPNNNKHFKHELWFPTSKQLHELFGLEFTGNVCADNSDCYENAINNLFAQGTSFAVGDEVYVSKGITENDPIPTSAP